MGKQKWGNILKQTWLCIKYPFLYPRNRWTGKHYNNWKIKEYHTENYKKAYLSFSIKISENKQTKLKYYYPLENDGYLRTDHKGNVLYIYLGNGRVEKLVKTEKTNSEIIDSGWLGNVLYITVEDMGEEFNFRITRITINRILATKIKILNWLEEYVLSLFHILTSYTELDSMPKGWRVAFGEDFCKDLKKALIKTGGYKLLFRFRFLQIKEKYGRLEVYCSGYNEEIQEVIRKYSELSEKTCIICGKPATWTSKGWISPYCDEHVPNKEDAIKIQ